MSDAWVLSMQFHTTASLAGAALLGLTSMLKDIPKALAAVGTSCRQREPEHWGTGATRVQGCAQHRATRGGGKAAFGAQGPSSESIQGHRYFCHLPVSVPLCKAAFPAAKHSFLLLLQAPTLRASLSELPKNRLPPEDGAYIPLNRGQALHSTVHFGATPRRNPATLYQNHQSKTHS